jgi:hypothetical protein
MSDVSIVVAYQELVREAKHREMWVDVDEYSDVFRVLDFSQKPAVHVGTCNSIDELLSIIHDTWKDEHGNWVSKKQEEENG